MEEQLKRRLLELKRQKLEALKADGLRWYRPHTKQDLFHRTKSKRRAVFSGNRFGKTTMGCAEDCAWLRGERVWLPPDDPARKVFNKPVKGVVLTTDWDMVDELWTSQRGTMGKIWQFLPPDFVKGYRRNHAGVIDTIECQNGSVLKFDTARSWINNPMGAESKDWDFIHVDEPIPEGMWKAYSRGLVDRNGWAWFTLTPLREAWIIDAFKPDGAFAQDSFTVMGSIYDNPYLPEDAIKMFEASLTIDEKQCRLYGIPLHLSGLVYKEFSYERHVIHWTPPKEYSHYYYIDPHPRVPHTVLFVAVGPDEKMYVWRDLFEPCRIPELCERMRSVLDGCNVIRGRIDPIAFIEDNVSGRTWADEFAMCGFPVEKAQKDPLHGIERVKERLCNGSLIFCDEARRTLWEIQRYSWNDETNKPVDKDDHAMECLYRAVLDEPTYVTTARYVMNFKDEIWENRLTHLFQ